MIAPPVTYTVPAFTYYHFQYFINKIECRIDSQNVIYGNKIMRAGGSYPKRHAEVAKAIGREYLARGIYAFIIVDRSEKFATVWHELAQSKPLINNREQEEEELELCLIIAPKNFR